MKKKHLGRDFTITPEAAALARRELEEQAGETEVDPAILRSVEIMRAKSLMDGRLREFDFNRSYTADTLEDEFEIRLSEGLLDILAQKKVAAHKNANGTYSLSRQI